jgi:hypothetical protein
MKYFELHNVSLSKSQPVYDKFFSNILGAKGSDGLRLSQTAYSRSENNLRVIAAALQNAEHLLTAVGALLKENGEEFDDLCSFLLQVDRCLCASEYLNLGTIANFYLARRQEILQKSSFSEFIKETLLFSPLHKDQLFGTSLRKLQEELHKEPPTVKVDVNLSGSGSRRVTVPAKQESRRSQGIS